jgi:hypothetical protein
MQIKNFSNHSNEYVKLYESKLSQCEFLSEQKITANDIINPLEDLITEEFIKKMIDRIGDSKFGQTVKNVASTVKTAVSNFFNGVVNFFKNFSFKKLIGGIVNKIKEIGSKAWQKVKDALSSMREFILQNNMVDPETGKPILKNIWSVLCTKAKSVINMKDSGLSDADLQKAGGQIQLNEAADKYDIGDDEVKYYGVFEKISHALGIKNARFNGVVSQIMKKGTIGLIIIGLMKVAGLSLGALAIANPIAMAVIGGMLLMAGLIILAIWICKPYPTVDDCLAYLHMFFGNNLKSTGITVIFSQTNYNINIGISGGKEEDVTTEKDEEPIKDDGGEDKKEPLPEKSLYPLMIKNLKALQSMLISFDGVSLEGDELAKGSRVKQKEKQKEKEKEKVRESLRVLSFSELILEKEFTKQPRNVKITKGEDYLTQAFKNITKSIQNIKNESDKGISITDKFVGDILSKKMEAKDVIKSLYDDIYEHLYGKYASTMPDFGALYKESVDVISKTAQRKIVAEKIARLAKRTMQFEGEGFYSGLGEFGADMEEFNTTLKQIMDSLKAENK